MDKTITVFLPVSTRDSELKSSDFASVATIPKELEVDPQRIVDELNKIVQIVNSVQAPTNANFELSELEFNLVVNGKGKLAILGIGLESGIQAAIKLKITKRTK